MSFGAKLPRELHKLRILNVLLKRRVGARVGQLLAFQHLCLVLKCEGEIGKHLIAVARLRKRTGEIVIVQRILGILPDGVLNKARAFSTCPLIPYDIDNWSVKIRF